MEGIVRSSNLGSLQLPDLEQARVHKMEKTPRLPRGIRPLEPTDFIPSLEKTFATALRFRQKASPRERSFLLWLRSDSIAVFLFFVLCKI